MNKVFVLFVLCGLGISVFAQVGPTSKGGGGGNSSKADDLKAKADVALQRCIAKVTVQNPPPPPQGSTPKLSSTTGSTQKATSKGK